MFRNYGNFCMDEERVEGECGSEHVLTVISCLSFVTAMRRLRTTCTGVRWDKPHCDLTLVYTVTGLFVAGYTRLASSGEQHFQTDAVCFQRD